MLGVVALPAAAQDSSPIDPAAPIVVTASRTGGDGATLATVTADDIARLQPPTLLDALNDVAGVRAVSTGGVGGGSFVSIRGGEPNFTLVLIDGIRVNNATNAQGGAFDFTLIDPASVGSIEVDRGATSAVHGSDALSGVINIRLRDPVRDTGNATVRATAGTDGERGGGATLVQGWGSGGILLGGSGYDSGDADPASRLDRRQAIARVRQRAGGFDATALALYAHSTHSEFPQDSGGPLLAVNRARETGTAELWTAALAIRRMPAARVRPNLSLSWSGQRDDGATPAIARGALAGVPAITAGNRLDRFEGIADISADLGPLTATAGGALLRERARSTGTIDFGFRLPTAFRLNRDTASGFAEATLRPGAGLTANAAGRYDAVRDGPHEWTARAGLTWRPMAAAPLLFARAGEGFKLPSFYALGNPLVGNPALRPERSRHREVGAAWTGTAGNGVRAAWFGDRFRDLIDFDAATFRIVNRATVATHGFELEGTWHADRALHLAGALSRVALDSDTPLRDRPRWQGNARAAWRPAAAIELNGVVRFNSRFFDSSVPTGPVTTAGHVEGDLGGIWHVARAIDLTATLRNVGDNRSRTAVGYPGLGRRLLVSLAVSRF